MDNREHPRRVSNAATVDCHIRDLGDGLDLLLVVLKSSLRELFKTTSNRFEPLPTEAGSNVSVAWQSDTHGQSQASNELKQFIDS